ncbi:14969_t:CDS:2, partial [Gigaspora rosea]
MSSVFKENIVGNRSADDTSIVVVKSSTDDTPIVVIKSCSQNATQNQILPTKRATFSKHATDSLNSSTIWLEKAIFE